MTEHFLRHSECDELRQKISVRRLIDFLADLFNSKVVR